MQIELHFHGTDRVIYIDLLPVAAVRAWFEFFRNRTHPDTPSQTAQPPAWHMNIATKMPDQIDPARLAQQWHRILASRHRLLALGYQFPWQLPPVWQGDQVTLNKLHRFFTTNEIWMRTLDQHFCGEANAYDAAWRWPHDLTQSQFQDIIDEINLAVHSLESHSDSVHGHWPGYSHVLVQNRGNQRNGADWLMFTEQQQQHNHVSLHQIKAHHSAGFDAAGPWVMLSDEILGKSVLHSFLDDDDPSEKDCTGRICSFGSFAIDLDHSRQDIYRSAEFLTWQRRHATVTQWPLEFVLGQVRHWQHSLPWLARHADRLRCVRFVPDPDHTAQIAVPSTPHITAGSDQPCLPLVSVPWPHNAVPAALAAGRRGFAVPAAQDVWHYYTEHGLYEKSWHADLGDHTVAAAQRCAVDQPTQEHTP